jgi:hypothetical protein
MTSELFTITSFPGRVPTAAGLNVTCTMHFPPAGSGDKEPQLSDSEKSPVVCRLIAPRPWHAEQLRRLASERGAVLSMEEIYSHSREFRAGRRLGAKSDVCRPRTPQVVADVLPLPSQPERRAAVVRVLRELGK